ncbi:hypothetical protein [Streptomyces sp. TP-A0875]|uniref:hypothetical protein n=1 Tax=Streptomyces sp. TP-A0875 TaxID=552354 RepID=UPI0006B696D6|nr:hypothetical protein [Streptomyces sp. TP-A0875]
MTEPTPHDPTAVALELERIRRTVEVGFERQAGSLALLVQRAGQTDRTVEELSSRVGRLERTRWPLPSIAAVVSVGGLALSLWQLTAR